MPSASDVRPTSHDRHDPLLVAALAAGDLAATDRDHATELIRSCAECATLHDDLVAIARATATVPPPIIARPRDFRLSWEQAARMRPSGWRRLVGAFGRPQLAFVKPLGIGLTTIGLAGLLLGNVSVGSLGSSAASAPNPAAAPAPYGATSESGPTDQRALGDGAGSGSSSGSEVHPAASGRYAQGVGLSPAATSVPAAASAPAAASVPAASVPPKGNDQVTVAGGPNPTSPGATEPSREAVGTPGPRTQLPTGPDPRTLVFVAAVILGLGLLVLRRVARRVTIA
jgi:hypothetical protein